MEQTPQVLVAFVLAAAPSLGTAAGLPTPPAFDPIVGGVPIEEGEFDAVVALRIDRQGNCTGTLVTPRVVLTAAHCFEQARDDSHVEVFFGPHTSGESMIAERFGIHPYYCLPCKEEIEHDRTQGIVGEDYVERFDFAFVELPDPYEPSDGLLLPLLDQQEWDDAMRIGNPITLVGFGKTDSDDSLPSHRPKHMVQTVLEQFSDHRIEFFAGQEEIDRDTCGGDSGGPAIVWTRDGEQRLAGVTSRGANPCGRGGWYGSSFAAAEWLDLEAGTSLLSEGCEQGDCVQQTSMGSAMGNCAIGGRPTAAAWLLPWIVLGLRRRHRPSMPGRRTGSARSRGARAPTSP